MPPLPILSNFGRIHRRNGSSPSIRTPKSSSRFVRCNLRMPLHPMIRISTKNRSVPSTSPHGRAYVLRCRFHLLPENPSIRALSFWTLSLGKVLTSFNQTSASVVGCWRCGRLPRLPRHTMLVSHLTIRWDRSQRLSMYTSPLRPRTSKSWNISCLLRRNGTRG